MKSKFENADFNFRKFDYSSDTVEKMINCQLKFKEKDMRNKGVGFAEIPPPYNQNYFSVPMSDEELLALPVKGYGPLVDEPINCTESAPLKISKPKSQRNQPPNTLQVPLKVFVRSQDVAKQTKTVDFEKN